MGSVDRDRVEYIISSHPDPVVTVGQVVDALEADGVETSDTTVRRRMEVLEAAGVLGRKEVGARAVAWWHNERVTAPRADPGDHPDQQALDESAPESERESGPVTDEEDSEEDWLAGVEKPPSTLDRAIFEMAAEAIVERAEEQGHVNKSGLVDALHKSHEAGYHNSDTWWRKVARPVLRACPQVSAPPKGGSDWQFVDETV